MATLVRILEAITLAALAILLGRITLFINHLEPKVLITVENIDRASIAAGAAAGNVEKASREWTKASTSQILQTSQAMSAVTATADAFSAFISSTDKSLNFAVLPSLREAISEQSASLTMNQKSLQQNLEQSRKLLADADQQINNPSISASLANIDAATLESAQTLQEAHASLMDVRQIADKARETYLKPANLWWAVVKEAIGIGGSMAQMIK